MLELGSTPVTTPRMPLSAVSVRQSMVSSTTELHKLKQISLLDGAYNSIHASTSWLRVKASFFIAHVQTLMSAPLTTMDVTTTVPTPLVALSAVASLGIPWLRMGVPAMVRSK